jgi:threonine/homoserine/homoserine lactone efflux protein
MTFIPDPSILLQYTFACVILFITPGPDMSLVLSRTLNGGFRHGVATLLGSAAGSLGHSLFAAIGLSALLLTSSIGFAVLKLVGAVYLLWMAFDAIRTGSSLNVRQDQPIHHGLTGSFLAGIGMNLTNPKVVLFFVTFLPQFIDAGDPHASGKLFFLGAFYAIMTIPLAMLMALAANSLIGWLKLRPGILRGIDYLFAGVFASFAIMILWTRPVPG